MYYFNIVYHNVIIVYHNVIIVYHNVIIVYHNVIIVSGSLQYIMLYRKPVKTMIFVDEIKINFKYLQWRVHNNTPQNF